MNYKRQYKKYMSNFSLAIYQWINIFSQVYAILRKCIHTLNKAKVIYYFPLFLLLGPCTTYAHTSLLPELEVKLQSNGNTVVPCNKGLGSCTITIAQNTSCLSQPGSIQITNTSNIVAQNISAFSNDINFLTYVVQNNGCPPRLVPGASCIISFHTNTGATFLVPNVAVKGRNTSSKFFDIQAINCIPPTALISASPLAVSMTTTGSGNTQNIYVVNSPSSLVNAEGISVNLSGTGGAISASYTNCSSVPPGSTCTITLTANSVLPTTSITIKGSNTNLVSASVSVVSPSLSVPSTAIIPVNDPTGVTITVSNLTADIITNVGVDLSSTGWAGVTSTTCPILIGNGTCTVTITSNTPIPYLAQGGIIFKGDGLNVSSPIALAFSIYDYLVFSIPDSSTAYVVDNNDATGSPVIWSSNGISGTSADFDYTSIWGVAENSSSSVPFPNTTEPSGQTAIQYPGQQNCNGNTDGACNTQNIYSYYNNIISSAPVSTSYYAAGLCYQITADNSGSVPEATWYLPAICQLGPDEGGVSSGCTSNTENITTNLWLLGFVSNLATNQFYWSSTQASSSPMSSAWYQEFRPGPVSQPFANVKFGEFSVRCVRAVNY